MQVRMVYTQYAGPGQFPFFQMCAAASRCAAAGTSLQRHAGAPVERRGEGVHLPPWAQPMASRLMCTPLQPCACTRPPRVGAHVGAVLWASAEKGGDWTGLDGRACGRCTNIHAVRGRARACARAGVQGVCAAQG